MARIFGSILVVGLTVMATGCGAPQTPIEARTATQDLISTLPEPSSVLPEQSPTSGDAGNVPDGYPAGSLVDRVLLRGQSFTEVSAKVQASIEACMHANGWNYEARPSVFTVGSEDLTLDFDQLEVMRTTAGYGIALSVTTVDPLRNHLVGMSDEEVDSFVADLGDSGGGGCQGAAEREVYTGLPFYDPTLSWMSSAFSDELLASPDFVEAQNAWSACMSDAGYSDPRLLRRTLSESLYSQGGEAPDGDLIEEVLAAEISLATADSTCYESTLLQVRPNLEEAILDNWVSSGRMPADMWPIGE